MTAQTITYVALSHLTRAPENARAETEHDREGLQKLAGSITALGGLLEPLKGYRDGEAVCIWDGGRRLDALRLLQKLPASMAEGVPVVITTQDEASLASMATFIRAEMHAADRFKAYSALFDEGHSADMIAAACGVSARGVSQILRFRMLAPEVLDTFKAGAMDFDAALAFTLSEDHERQRQVLASFGEQTPDAWSIKRALREGSVGVTDRRARFVGRDAYAEAGGRFLSDLFSNKEVDETWLDVGILTELYDAKLAALVADVKAEGWGEVTVAADAYGWRYGLDHVAGAGDDKAHTPEQMADLSAIIVFDYDATVKVHRGFRKAGRGGAQAGAAAAPLTPAKKDPARYGWSHVGHLTLTTVATRATQAALLSRPDVAYDAVLTHLAWQALGCLGNAEEGVSTLAVPYSHSRPRPTPEVSDALKAWAERLPTADRTAFCEEIGALSADDKAALLAASFASTLDATEGKNDYRRQRRWAHLGWIARRAGVDFAAFWTPTGEWLKGGSREALEGVVAEVAPEQVAWAKTAKKGSLVSFLAQKVEAARWVPQVLRDLLVEPKAPKVAAKKPAKGKAKG